MKRKKQLKELTLKDNFMFGAVMMEEENCRRFLELALGFPIEYVEISRPAGDSLPFIEGKRNPFLYYRAYCRAE